MRHLWRRRELRGGEVRFLWLIPFGALLLADFIGMILAFLLVPLGFDGVIFLGLLSITPIPLALYFGRRVGRSRSGRAMTFWDLNIGIAIYAALSTIAPAGDAEVLLSLALIAGKLAAFAYGLEKSRPGLLTKTRSCSNLDAKEPGPPFWRRRWFVAVAAYSLTGAVLILPLNQLAEEHGQTRVDVLTTAVMVVGWPAVIGLLGYQMLDEGS